MNTWSDPLAETGVSGTDIREGESSALRMVCSWSPVVCETPEESDRANVSHVCTTRPLHAKRDVCSECVMHSTHACFVKATNCASLAHLVLSEGGLVMFRGEGVGSLRKQLAAALDAG